MANKKHSAAIVIAIAVVLTITGWAFDWGIGVSADYIHDIRKNVEVFGLVYQEISKKYVDPVDPEKFMKAGINGMLETLDPYTVLIEQDDNSHLQIITTGKYGGLGMRISQRNGWPTVVDQPFEYDPAGKAGIIEGDRIIEVDGTSTKGLSTSEVAQMLRGEIGTEVDLKIQREGVLEPLEFRLIRAEITVHDVSYSGIIEDGIGYIKLAGFSKNAGYEIRQAIRDMKSEGLKGLVLDLRNNPGGLLDAAVSVAENFIAKDELIVSTKGRSDESKREYHAKADPILGSLPLVVLVNEYSASASEIVSGAVQDLDRGVVMGTPTFGKGLVQTVVPITREAALKITTAKYYIPSGRLIQRPDRQYNQSEISVLDLSDERDQAPADSTLSDSLIYHTVRNKREVYGGGGIRPDIIVKAPPVSRYEFELKRKSMLFQFALIYVSQHKDEIETDFEVDDRLLAEFRAFLKEKHFSYVSESEEALVEFKKAAEAEGYLAKLDEKISLLESALDAEKKDDFDKNREMIAHELKKEIVAKRFGTRAKVETGFESDPVLKEALSVLKNQKRYTGILSKQQSDKG